MKQNSILKKLDQIGLKGIEISGKHHKVRAPRHIITWTKEGEDVENIHVRHVNDEPDSQTDYFPGSFHTSIKGALLHAGWDEVLHRFEHGWNTNAGAWRREKWQVVFLEGRVYRFKSLLQLAAQGRTMWAVLYTLPIDGGNWVFKYENSAWEQIHFKDQTSEFRNNLLAIEQACYCGALREDFQDSCDFCVGAQKPKEGRHEVN